MHIITYYIMLLYNIRLLPQVRHNNNVILIKLYTSSAAVTIAQTRVLGDRSQIKDEPLLGPVKGNLRRLQSL